MAISKLRFVVYELNKILLEGLGHFVCTCLDLHYV